jgi:hypothetical protein
MYALVGAAWATAVAVGAARLWRYESVSADAAGAAVRWPADTRLVRDAGLPTLVLALHPKCPCSRATVGELAKLMTDCSGKLFATVLVLRPTDQPAGWERTSLWSDAAAIPGVKVIADDNGEESRRFGATTSGQAMLYAPAGRLLFAGGITESRGHSGDNAGRSAITTLVLGDAAPPSTPVHTPVYGCSLFDSNSTCRKTGRESCRQ